MSSDLQWLLLRKNNSYMVKGLPEGPIMSKEPGNLMNLHSHKYSGISNQKTIHIQDTNGTIEITTSKKNISPTKVKSSRVVASVRPRSGGRRAYGVVVAAAKRNYRPDLRKAALARTSALLAAQKEPKPTPEKKLRGKKKVAAAAAATEDV